MNKKTVKSMMVILMLLVVALYFIAGTYARYTSSVNATAKVDIAKWAVAFKSGGATMTENMELTFALQNNTNVVSGKIAPASKAVATVEVDLTGTEVAVDFDADVDTTAIASVFGDSASDVNATVTVSGAASSADSATVNLIGDKAFTADNGKVTLTITLEWTNTEANNAKHTETGTAGGTLTIPVTITAQQHI